MATNSICSIDGCGKRVIARGWCSTHYDRWKNHGVVGGKSLTPRRGTCSVEGCGQPHNAHGLCANHAYRLRKHGSPLGGKTPNGEPMAWIKRHIGTQEQGCITWPYAKVSGYGRIGKSESACRLMCEMAHGAPPEPMYEAAHSCGRGSLGCCNPNHLSWKTPKENQADRVVHGTTNRGPRHGAAILTEDLVRRVRHLRERLSAKEVSALTGVSINNVYKVANRQTWAWLD